MSIKRLNITGDTIVEVMIVLAVLGLAISIAYATANRSLLDARQAQENAEATELVQSQVEQLRTLASITNSLDPNYVYRPSLFCLYTNSGTVKVAAGFNGSNPLNYASYPSSPTPCVNSFYHISVTDTGADTFRVEAVWDDVSGQGQDTVTMVYKVHPL